MPISNVLLVTVDSLRADAIGPYDDRRHTPVLDYLAAHGTVFERAFATGNWTPFSFPSLLASRPVFADTGSIGVTESPTLATTLADEGVATGGFNAANGFLTEHWGYDDGFDEFDAFVTDVGSGRYGRYLATHPTVEAWLQLATSPLRRLRAWVGGDADDRPFLDASRLFAVEDAATSFIADADGPFFCWVHYMDTHTPYVPAPRYIREVSGDRVGTHRMLHAHVRTGLGLDVDERTLAELRTLYQAAARQVDASIGRLRETLAATGHYDDTAIVVVGDHGEEFQEHGHLAHYPKLYDELVHVPLIVDVPGVSGGRVAEHVGLDAIPPTVADLLDADPDPAWTGDSLVPTIVNGESPRADPVISVAVRGEEVTSQPIPRSLDDGELLVSARDREWTYIRNVDADTAELYHRPTDSAERDDLHDDPTPEAADAIDRLAPAVDDHAALLREATAARAADGDDDDASTDLEAHLEALGYR